MVRLALAGVRVNEVDARRFDVYSAGAVLYFLIEGQFPACGPLSEFQRPVPFALQWMVAQAMADASKRYPSIEVMLADLEAFLARSKRGRMDEVKPAGYYTAQWDASELSSGVYFYRIQAGDFTATRRMVLMK